MSDELRYAVEVRSLSRWQRIRSWWLNVLDAIQTSPDRTYSTFIVVGKDDPRYDAAPYAFVIEPHPARFKFENGECVQVDVDNLPKTESNPNWHDA